LERDVARLFKLIGMEPQLNVRFHGYEIDVFITYRDKKIAVECKQYESGSLNVRNLIHEWHSKSEELGIDKVILVIAGYRIRAEHAALANKYGIIIWDEETFDTLFSKAIESREATKDEILSKLGLKRPVEPPKAARSKEEAIIEERILTELSDNVRQLTHCSLINFYSSLKVMLFLHLTLGLLFLARAFNYWLFGLILLMILSIVVREMVISKRHEGVLLALAELQKIRKMVSVDELATLSGLSTKEVRNILKDLEREEKIYSPREGFWRIK
ncbi:hypothetical protein DRO64_05135, partial [Candidatus Bathyarchaeota archaeon]